MYDLGKKFRDTLPSFEMLIITLQLCNNIFYSGHVSIILCTNACNTENQSVFVFMSRFCLNNDLILTFSKLQ